MTRHRAGIAGLQKAVEGLKVCLRPMRRATVGLLRELRKALRVPMYVVEGKERASGTRLKVFFGGKRKNLECLSLMWFDGAPHVKELGEYWLWEILFTSLSKDYRACLLVLDMNKRVYELLAAKRGVFVPHWIGGEIQIAEALERTKKVGNIKEDIRRIRKNGFEYEVTLEPERFERFYTEMYVPYMRATYGNTAFLMTHREMLEKMDNAELLVITKDREDIAAVIVLHEGVRMRAWSVGVKNGDRFFVKQGALAALYYFQVLHARDKGYATLHLGGSRPFLQDGVLQFKKKWGVRLSETTHDGFLIIPRTKGALSLVLKRSPFIFLRKNKLMGAFFIDYGADLSRDELFRLFKIGFFPGMSALNIYPLDSNRQVSIPDELSRIVSIGDPRDLFGRDCLRGGSCQPMQ